MIRNGKKLTKSEFIWALLRIYCRLLCIRQYNTIGYNVHAVINHSIAHSQQENDDEKEEAGATVQKKMKKIANTNPHNTTNIQ